MLLYKLTCQLPYPYLKFSLGLPLYMWYENQWKHQYLFFTIVGTNAHINLKQIITSGIEDIINIIVMKNLNFVQLNFFTDFRLFLL